MNANQKPTISRMIKLDEGKEFLEKALPSKTTVVDNCLDNPKEDRVFAIALSLAMGNAADAVEIICVGFIMSEMGDISSFDKEFLSAAVFMGMLVGGLASGYFSDSIGRRPCLMYSLALNAIAGLASAAAPDITTLIACRVVGGLGIGGSVPVVFSAGAEIFPSATRGKYLSIIASFWMVGAIFTAFSAWVMLGDDFSGHRIIRHINWRWFAIVSALPAIVALLLTHYIIPESPRFLIGKKRYIEATVILNDISMVQIDISDIDPSAALSLPYSVENGNSNNRHYNDIDRTISLDKTSVSNVNSKPLATSSNNISSSSGAARSPSLCSDSSSSTSDPEDTNSLIHGASGGSKLLSSPSIVAHYHSNNINNDHHQASTRNTPAVATTQSTLLLLFQDAKLRHLSITLVSIWFTLSFGTYGMSTWISTLFSDVGIGNPYAATFIFALANLPGNIISLMYIEVFGRRWLLSVGMCLAGASALGFAFDTTIPAVVVLCAALFNGFSVIGWNSLDCLSGM